jgi:hypothetical protein
MAAIGQGIPVPARQSSGLVRPNLGVLLALLLLAGAAAFPVFVRSDASSRGQEMQQLTLERGLITGEIRQLEADLAELASVDRIRRDALSLGMTPADDDLYVQVEVPAPADLEVPFAFRPEQEEPAPVVEDQSWWRDLLDSLPFR